MTLILALLIAAPKLADFEDESTLALVDQALATKCTERYEGCVDLESCKSDPKRCGDLAVDFEYGSRDFPRDSRIALALTLHACAADAVHACEEAGRRYAAAREMEKAIAINRHACQRTGPACWELVHPRYLVDVPEADRKLAKEKLQQLCKKQPWICGAID